ncbi:hypothetical protein RchiOBHm_Chr5g0034561 [Rosa chinensis]|uniref:Uncharacterized protein n=1 Tax=Rosa chinensis TaxID=74649 RepID=A0A2P6QB16_ROSCH|nr:hypothetical protein RchiOBHm_Chr5g0034561 [Rosa chinensis]
MVANRALDPNRRKPADPGPSKVLVGLGLCPALLLNRHFRKISKKTTKDKLKKKEVGV